ncbi:MAG: hypothetical protein CVV44_04120 [Spirochaetae bacterium HGW-Spirochaetae-1]|nr:MAG: hypothetical protein CVV44_04120 [Spirochaetae bacterium HGW-Spirochaetae-1]
MSIEYYHGTEGPTINIESHQDLINALDILHTQCMDNLPEDSIATTVLVNAMEALSMEHDIYPE